MTSRQNGHGMRLRMEDFRRQLLTWYDAHARDLPWREDQDPYRVWVSEIMLQQTRVAAVIEHYHGFLRRFPTVQKLAAAREASVLAAWSGLGYYRRARMLHAAAKLIARERRGVFPNTVEGWRELPGIGRYTSAAIASIAFGEPVAVVDGNVERVLQRFSGEMLDGEKVWQLAEELLESRRPGDFNQAMMELGATVCTPKSPSCLMCPVVDLCATRGEMAGIGKTSRQQKREIHYALDRRDGKVFLVQRAANSSLMAGMWELPEISAEVLSAGIHQIPPARFARRRNDKGSAISPGRGRNGKITGIEPARCSDGVVSGENNGFLFTVKHSITVTDYTVGVWKKSLEVEGKWVPAEKLARIALTGLARKILRKAEVI